MGIITQACKDRKHELCKGRAVTEGPWVECTCSCHNDKNIHSVSKSCARGKHHLCEKKDKCRCTCHLKKERTDITHR